MSQDISVLIPVKLMLVYIVLPSLMRHRMRPDMFKRIPRYAPSMQIARRRPDLQVSIYRVRVRVDVFHSGRPFLPPRAEQLRRLHHS